jgi:hypothetical protein
MTRLEKPVSIINNRVDTEHIEHWCNLVIHFRTTRFELLLIAWNLREYNSLQRHVLTYKRKPSVDKRDAI